VKLRRERAIAYLGGQCVRCGTTDQLEFDHVDRATKSYLITANLNRRWEVLVQELDKCQLLCHDCHRAKTRECGETGGGHNRLTPDDLPHGTGTGYTYWRCRCEPCRQARYEDRVRCGDLPGTGTRRGQYKSKPS
jgi:hypothetical protein